MLPDEGEDGRVGVQRTQAAEGQPRDPEVRLPERELGGDRARPPASATTPEDDRGEGEMPDDVVVVDDVPGLTAPVLLSHSPPPSSGPGSSGRRCVGVGSAGRIASSSSGSSEQPVAVVEVPPVDPHEQEQDSAADTSTRLTKTRTIRTSMRASGRSAATTVWPTTVSELAGISTAATSGVTSPAKQSAERDGVVGEGEGEVGAHDRAQPAGRLERAPRPRRSRRPGSRSRPAPAAPGGPPRGWPCRRPRRSSARR